MSVERQRSDLARTAKLIERNGLATGDYVNDAGEVCILGGLAIAIGGCIQVSDGVTILAEAVPERFIGAARRLWCFLPPKWHDKGDSFLEDIIEFNDADESAVRDRVFREAISNAEVPRLERDIRDLILAGDVVEIRTESTAG